jgi:thiol-disulfide isomerase/thioredoxin
MTKKREQGRSPLLFSYCFIVVFAIMGLIVGSVMARGQTMSDPEFSRGTNLRKSTESAPSPVQNLKGRDYDFPDIDRPILKFPYIDGALLRGRKIMGQNTVMTFWATWCEPCNQQMPILMKAAADNGDIQFMFVNQGEAAATIDTYLRKNKYPSYQVYMNQYHNPFASYVRGLPTTLFINRVGRVQYAKYGALGKAELNERLNTLRDKNLMIDNMPVGQLILQP